MSEYKAVYNWDHIFAIADFQFSTYFSTIIQTKHMFKACSHEVI